MLACLWLYRLQGTVFISARHKTAPKLSGVGRFTLHFMLLVIFLVSPFEVLAAAPGAGSLSPDAAPAITNITTNASAYPNSQPPKYSKFEITFKVQTTATNPYLPFSASAPSGVSGSQGITVDALFSPDNWVTTYRQPAFYYQEYLDEVRSGNEWFYPTGNFSWKVRFAPTRTGTWQFKLTAQDAGGTMTTTAQSFTVANSSNPGFVRVSPNDNRYFQFDNGTYFPGLGYNMNYDHVRWTNPVLDNQENFQKMGQNGIQLVRVWLSEWGIMGPSWNPWNSMDPAEYTASTSRPARSAPRWPIRAVMSQ